MKKHIWLKRQGDRIIAERIASELKVSFILAQILQNRGIATSEEGRAFLFGSLEHLCDPFELKGMGEAVARVREAIDNKEEILIYGDYDVDGVTSSALLVLALRELGGRVSFYLPNRFTEGYGLNAQALERAKGQGISLIITVDCGISNITEALRAKELGIDLIISDHHEPGENLPEALALINPKLQGDAYPWSQLSGVGVAFKLVQALFNRLEGISLKEAGKEYLDIVALGTVADLVPLQNENRILVKEGLEVLNRSTRPGIEALRTVCKLKDKKVTAGHLGFMLAPRLNAAGRLGDASQGVELLITESQTKAMEIAIFLDAENQERQRIEAEIFQEAVDYIEQRGLQNDPALVLAFPNWHPGVIGIVASRLVERYHRPTVLIAIENGIGKSSCRSISGFHMFQALQKCSQYLLKFGGHAAAAGLSIREGDIPAFEAALKELARETLTVEDYTPKVKLDHIIDIDELSEDLLEELMLLEPYGMGNPSPVLGSGGRLVQFKPVGKSSEHLKLTLSGQRKSVGGIGFQLGHLAETLQPTSTLDVAYALELNTWQEKTSLQLNIKALKDSNEPDNPYLFERLSKTMAQLGLRDGLDMLAKELAIFNKLKDEDICQIVDEFPKDTVSISYKQMDLLLHYIAILQTPYLQVLHPTAKGAEIHYRYLLKQLSGSSVNIGRYHQGMCKRQRLRTLDTLNNEEVTILVIQDSLMEELKSLPNKGKRIKYIGYDREKDYSSYSQAIRAWERILTKNVEDFILMPLEENYQPKREELVLVYSMLIKTGREEIPLSQVMRSLRPRLDEAIIIFALLVFEQLGFIDIIDTEELKITVQPKPQSKVELSEAPLYKEQVKSSELYQQLLGHVEVATTTEH